MKEKGQVSINLQYNYQLYITVHILYYIVDSILYAKYCTVYKILHDAILYYTIHIIHFILFYTLIYYIIQHMYYTNLAPFYQQNNTIPKAHATTVQTIFVQLQ